MAILQHGQTIGSIGGVCSEAEVMRKAIDVIREGGHCLIDIEFKKMGFDYVALDLLGYRTGSMNETIK